MNEKWIRYKRLFPGLYGPELRKAMREAQRLDSQRKILERKATATTKQLRKVAKRREMLQKEHDSISLQARLDAKMRYEAKLRAKTAYIESLIIDRASLDGLTISQARLRALLLVPDDDDQPATGALDWQDVISKW